jgi:hypothetical protein
LIIEIKDMTPEQRIQSQNFIMDDDDALNELPEIQMERRAKKEEP